MRAWLDMPYPVLGGECRFDIIRPDDDVRRPLLVFIHGGGWISGEKETYREEAAWYAQHGYATACVGYRLAPLYPFPTPVADVQRFLVHAAACADDWGVGGQPVVTFGNSAGGHLSLMAALCPQVLDGEEPACQAQAAVSVCGITDIGDPDAEVFEVAFSFLHQFMGGEPAGREEAYRAASPTTYAQHAKGPVLLFHGEVDDIVPYQQMERMATALRRNDKEIAEVGLAGEGHGFTLGAWSMIREKTLDFLSRVAPVSVGGQHAR